MHKAVLVTGASSGIGEATAVHLAHRGFTVFAAARRLTALNTLSGLGHGRIHPIALDVTDPTSINDAISKISADYASPLYGLVNNAGISVTGPVEQLDMEDWRRQFETNVLGVVAMTKAVLPQMRAENAGRIITVGSVAGRIVAPFMGAYGASKHAIEGLSDALRHELSGTDIKVSVIRPSFVNTQFGEQEQAGLEAHMADGEPYAEDVRAFAKWHERGHPNGVAPSEVAEAIHQALTAKNPQSRYTVPKKFLGYMAMRNFLPSALVDRVLYKTIGLKR